MRLETSNPENIKKWYAVKKKKKKKKRKLTCDTVLLTKVLILFKFDKIICYYPLFVSYLIQDSTLYLVRLSSFSLMKQILINSLFIFIVTNIFWFSFLCLLQFSSVAQSWLTRCNLMDCSMPGFPIHHQLPELVQTHVHRVGDAIQPSHPLSSPSPPALNLS